MTIAEPPSPIVPIPSPSTGTAGTAVQVQNVSRRFEEFQAVRDVSLDVDRGTILGLIGPSGSGKTTVVRMLIGTLEPSEGTIKVMGESPRHFRRKTRERLGYMPQSFVLYPDLTTSENLSLVGSLFGMLWRRRRARKDTLLKLLGLWDARDRRTSHLSGGMKRRLALACALIHEPEVIFVDEPTAGIDPVLRQTIWEEFRRLRDQGRTLFVTTQYVGESEYCDQVAMLDKGAVIARDSPEALRRSAFGGEMIELETARTIDEDALRSTPEVQHARMRGSREALVTVEHAGEAIPRLIEALDASGNEVVSAREYRPSFDEVFTELLQRSQEQSPERGDEGQ
jgi:ABC-2 type transport system ATP-binding protein